MGKLFFIGDFVKHHLYGVGEIIATGYGCATVEFTNGIVTTCNADNLTLLPY